MSAEAIALDCAPCHFEPRRTLIAGPDSIHPMVIGGEIPAGPSQNAYIQFARGIHDVFAEPVGIRERGTFFEYAAVDAPAKVLDEIAIDLRVDVADDAFGIDFDAGAHGWRLRSQDEGRGRERPGKGAAGNRHGVSFGKRLQFIKFALLWCRPTARMKC